MFKKITTETPGKTVSILDECAASTIHQNIHGHNALFENKNDRDHTDISIKYRQNKERACVFFNWLVLYIMFRIKS